MHRSVDGALVSLRRNPGRNQKSSITESITNSALLTHAPLPYPVVNQRTCGNARHGKGNITIHSLEREISRGSDVRPITSIHSPLAANFGQN